MQVCWWIQRDWRLYLRQTWMCYFPYQRRVFVGLTKEGWDRHPDKEETLEAMKSANNVILFTNIESDLNLPSDISIAVKSLDILSADDFISEVVNGESVNA